MAKTPLVDVDRETGEYISGWPRIEQSIKTILNTRLNTRVMREWWGSDFLDTMDKPMVSQVFALSLIAAAYYIDLYEPEFKVTSVTMTPSADGSCRVLILGIDLTDDRVQTASTTIYSSR